MNIEKWAWETRKRIDVEMTRLLTIPDEDWDDVISESFEMLRRIDPTSVPRVQATFKDDYDPEEACLEE